MLFTLYTHVHHQDNSIGNSKLQLSDRVCNLGVTLDKELSLSHHINETCKKATLAIRLIGRLQRYLNKDHLKMMVNAFVMSRLDYCNSLYCGLPRPQLQRVQNSAVRLISRMRRTDHITPVIKKLHWLPVDARIDFKILLLTYKILNGLAPNYLSPILARYQPARLLRTSNIDVFYKFRLSVQ